MRATEFETRASTSPRREGRSVRLDIEVGDRSSLNSCTCGGGITVRCMIASPDNTRGFAGGRSTSQPNAGCVAFQPFQRPNTAASRVAWGAKW